MRNILICKKCEFFHEGVSSVGEIPVKYVCLHSCQLDNVEDNRKYHTEFFNKPVKKDCPYYAEQSMFELYEAKNCGKVEYGLLRLFQIRRTCQHCGKKLFRFKKTCPNCGHKYERVYWINAWFVRVQDGENESVEYSRRISDATVFAIFLLVVGALLWIFRWIL